MLRIALLIFTIICFASVVTWVSASGVVVIDKKDVKAEITNVENQEIKFKAGKSQLKIPIEKISTIRLTEDGKEHVLKIVTGAEVIATTIYGELNGTWELGDYSVGFQNIKYVDFGRPVQKNQVTTMVDQPRGFFAICTDRVGVGMKVYGFHYNYWESHSVHKDPWTGDLYFRPRSRTDKYNPREFLPVKRKDSLKEDTLIVEIPFANIDSIKFTDEKTTEAYTWYPALTIKLIDDQTLSGKLHDLGNVGNSQEFRGETVFGEFSINTREVHQIVFDHKRDKDIKNKVYHSPYIISLKTWSGEQLTLLNARTLGSENTKLEIRIGASTTTVDFDKIKSIQFQRKGIRQAKTIEGQMTTVSDKTIGIELSVDPPRYNYAGWPRIGGDLGKIGGSWRKIGETGSAEQTMSRATQASHLKTHMSQIGFAQIWIGEIAAFEIKMRHRDIPRNSQSK